MRHRILHDEGEGPTETTLTGNALWAPSGVETATELITPSVTSQCAPEQFVVLVDGPSDLRCPTCSWNLESSLLWLPTLREPEWIPCKQGGVRALACMIGSIRYESNVIQGHRFRLSLGMQHSCILLANQRPRAGAAWNSRAKASA